MIYPGNKTYPAASIFVVLLLMTAAITGCGKNNNSGLDGGCGPEVCDGKDNDCDGDTDEDDLRNPLRRKCQTQCGEGYEECVGGTYKYCTAPTPSTEVCDGFDNNCDSHTDEGCNCVHGTTEPCGDHDKGICRKGQVQCIRGEWGNCVGKIDPKPAEICGNGEDDNCDGQTDEGCSCTPNDTQACHTDEGECVKGSQTCEGNGQWSDCTNYSGPFPEKCDGLDNNCDGHTDEFWAVDTSENNNTCASAALLSDAEEGGDMVRLMGGTIYPMGDVDWYQFWTREGNGACFPFTRQCSFVLTLVLALEPEQDPQDWELCVGMGECAQVEGPTGNLICTHLYNYDSAISAYVFALKYGGKCLQTDDQHFKVAVRTPTGRNTCGTYNLGLLFTFDPDEDCP